MNYDLILQNITRHTILNQEEKDYIKSLLTFKKVKRKTLVQTEGELCRYINYVQSGILRAYYLDKNGKESTIMFAASDWWVTDMYCFVNQKPAMMYIEALEDSILIQLTKENLDKLYDHVPKFERVFRILMQNAYIREQLRMIANLSLTAKERYDDFYSKYPHIAALVTQKQIASYLGMTPEFFSFIRRNKAKIS
jgi:CRP/FNR family transcriptional regulator, anaerobic regulatory protein